MVHSQRFDYLPHQTSCERLCSTQERYKCRRLYVLSRDHTLPLVLPKQNDLNSCSCLGLYRIGKCHTLHKIITWHNGTHCLHLISTRVISHTPFTRPYPIYTLGQKMFSYSSTLNVDFSIIYKITVNTTYSQLI